MSARAVARGSNVRADGPARHVRQSLTTRSSASSWCRDMLIACRTSSTERGLPFTDQRGSSSGYTLAARSALSTGPEADTTATVTPAAAGGEQLPLPQAITPESEDPVRHALEVQQERCLLFVACTRARERLRVSYSGERSDLIPVMQTAS